MWADNYETGGNKLVDIVPNDQKQTENDDEFKIKIKKGGIR